MKSIFLSIYLIKNRNFITISEAIDNYVHSIVSSYAPACIVSNFIYHLSMFVSIYKKLSNHNLYTIFKKYKMFYVKHLFA